MVALIISWNIYRQDYQLIGLPKNQMLSRRKIQYQVAAGLISAHVAKRGRPSSGTAEMQVPAKFPSTRQRTETCEDVRLDGYCHWPTKVGKRGRCKVCQTNITNTQCSKCNARLCFVEGRNCFVTFDQK